MIDSALSPTARLLSAGHGGGASVGAVAVVIPTHRRPRDVRAAVDSVLRHGDRVTEVVVVDDGRDLDPAVLPTAVRLLTHEHRGVSAARNRGTSATTAEFVYFLDDDDELQPGAIGRLVEQADSDAGNDVVFGRWCTVDASGSVLRTPATALERALPQHLATRTAAPLSACLFRRGALAAVGGFDPAFDGLEDWELLVRLQHEGARFGFCDHVVARYVDHPGSHSKNWTLVSRVGHALVDATLRRLGIDDAATAGTLHRYLVVETARRAQRAGDIEVAQRLLGRTRSDLDATANPNRTAEQWISANASRLREEAERSISKHLCARR